MRHRAGLGRRQRPLGGGRDARGLGFGGVRGGWRVREGGLCDRVDRRGRVGRRRGRSSALGGDCRTQLLGREVRESLFCDHVHGVLCRWAAAVEGLVLDLDSLDVAHCIGVVK